MIACHPGGVVAWAVLGEELPVKVWAIQHGMNAVAASGVLIACLEVLARHYGRILRTN